ncbi:MAG: hypothetical protein INR71_06185, partial [Terriglobus roseus]|nr:hypothetical protein [Terriglobus roseus]
MTPSSQSGSQQRTADQQDLPSFVASVGSPQGALEQLWREKQSSVQQTEQLWRLVEKQRAMILGLNKDLERALKDKERYRKKLKEHLAQQPPLPNGVRRTDSALDRAHSQSPAPSEVYDPAGRESVASEHIKTTTLLQSDANASGGPDSPLDNKSSMAASQASSDPSPKDSEHAMSNDALRNRGNSVAAHESGALHASRAGSLKERRAEASARATVPQTANNHQNGLAPTLHAPQLSIASENTPTVSLTQPTPVVGNQPFASSPPAGAATTLAFASSATRPPISPPGFSPTSSRKPPPAPLNLSKTATVSAHLQQQQAGEVEDSNDDDILDDGEEVPPIMRERGRRKTREEDDALREAIAMNDERSKSKKKSKSTSKPAPIPVPDLSSHAIPEPPQTAKAQAVPPPVPGLGFVGLPASPRLPPPEAAGSINALLSPTNADSFGRGTERVTHIAAPLPSAGLPASPRPTQLKAPQQPVGLPMSPRAGKTTFAAAPLSPRPGVGVGMGGAMPLSPRAPRAAIPLPPTSPLAAGNPHLQRAEHHAQGADSSLAARLAAPVARASAQDNSQGGAWDADEPAVEIYQGLKDDRYPGLLLPPNALPSIDAKVYSSRMRPSRHSMLLSKPDEDPVFQLGIYARSNGKQLWRVEKTTSALARLHNVVLGSSPDFTAQLPDRALFDGHAPAKIDARRAALNAYFDVMLDTEMDERTAVEVCNFFSSNVIEPENESAQTAARVGRRQQQDPQPKAGAPAPQAAPKQKMRKEGYLTKRGKNFGGWKARYFVLDGSALTYFDAPGGQEIGRIRLANAQIGKQQQSSQHRTPSEGGDSTAEDNEYRHAFLVLEPKRKDERALVRHVLCAESDAERDAWVSALLLHVETKADAASTSRQQQQQQ